MRVQPFTVCFYNKQTLLSPPIFSSTNTNGKVQTHTYVQFGHPLWGFMRLYLHTSLNITCMGDNNNHKYTIFITVCSTPISTNTAEHRKIFSSRMGSYAHLSLLNDLMVTERATLSISCASELQKLYTPMNLIYKIQR